MKLPDNLLPRGLASIVIGASLLLAPTFIGSTDLQTVVRGAAWVGWLAIIVGSALIAIFMAQRKK